ncbi:MAG: tetratricopeptide repeat protein [Bacteroidota bacterium]
MQPKRKLKVIPLYRFFQIMDLPSKGLFLVLYGALLALAIGSIMAAEDPVRWSLQVNEFHAPELEEIALREYKSGYRTMNTEIGAWKEQVSFVATPIVPQAWLVLVFVLAQVLGWSYLMAAATYLKNWFAYIVYFAFAMVIFISGAFESIAPENSWLFNLGLAVLLFGPAYLLQQGVIRMAYPLRLLIFAVVGALPFFLQFQFQGWSGLHSSTVGMYAPLVIILFVYLFFVGNDLSNLMFFLATNAKDKRYRVRFPVILGVFLVISALQFLMLQHLMGWDIVPYPEDFPLRPVHLLALAAVVMVGTKQNMFPILKHSIDNRGMSMGFTALSVIALSTFFFHAALGDHFFVLMIERVAVILFFLTGLFHFFYIFYNFGPLIRARVNFYFLSMMPKRLLYFFVVIATALVGFAFEASGGGRTQKLFSGILYNRLADLDFLAGNIPEAMTLYGTAVGVSDGNIKANYNLAMLFLTRENIERARESFTKAARYDGFAPAILNRAGLEVEEFRPSVALDLLKTNQERVEDPYIANNLALLYKAYGKVDSAVIQMKKALSGDPDNSGMYANLARIYLENDKPEWAEKFLTAGLATENPGAAIVTNALFYNIRNGSRVAIPDSLAQLPAIQEQRSALFNFALERYRTGNFTAAKGIMDTLLARQETPDVLLLDGMLLFEQGKISESLSRMLYLDANYPKFRRYAYHYLAVAFFARGVPEMAAQYFGQSVASGRSEDLLNQAYMEIDRGDHDAGFQLLNEVRVQDSTQFEAVAKESAMLQMARGEYFFALLGFDAGSLTKDDWTRVGLYAGKIDNIPGALEAFRRLIEKDSSSVIPYLEMGRISLRLGDSLVFSNLQPGLDLEPEHVGLRTVKARALLRRGETEAAMALYRDLIKAAPDDTEVRLLEAEVALARQDTAAAIGFYEKLHAAHPLDQEAVIGLSKLYRATRQDFDGQNMVYDALDINPRNADFWYQMAHFERLLNRESACGGAAVQAARWSINDARAAEIEAEFDAEIAFYRAENPE